MTQPYLDFNNSIPTQKKHFYSLKPNKSARYDIMQMHLIKGSYKFIQRPVKYIFNLSFKYREFPNKLKIARVASIFKSSDETLFTNYRPISILPCLSKIL